jgi:hypothetical protein
MSAQAKRGQAAVEIDIMRLLRRSGGGNRSHTENACNAGTRKRLPVGRKKDGDLREKNLGRDAGQTGPFQPKSGSAI